MRNFIRKILWAKSGKPVDEGQTITIDHVTDKFEIVIRSSSGVTIDQIRTLIQSRHEVIKMEHIDCIVYAK